MENRKGFFLLLIGSLKFFSHANENKNDVQKTNNDDIWELTIIRA